MNKDEYIRMGDLFFGYQHIRLFYDLKLHNKLVISFELGKYISGYYKTYDMNNTEIKTIKSDNYSITIGLKYRLK